MGQLMTFTSYFWPMRNVVLAIFFLTTVRAFSSQSDSTKLLIADVIVQIEATEAMDAMYDFDFKEAEKQFHWLEQKHPPHPLPYFVQGLNEWWKMVPNVNIYDRDEQFHHFMDTAIAISEPMLDDPETRIEAAFFLAAAYGFKGRLYSERGTWGKAAAAGKKALNYLEISKEQSDLSPELLFGDALYNYYSVWIPDNYGILKPIMAFFPKGDKEKGIDQLREVANYAFYTRIEARIFLMQILANENNDYKEALRISKYLVEKHPSNPYFQRYYMRYLYSTRRYRELEPTARDIMAKVEAGIYGYEYTSGRWAGFFLGQMYQSYRNFEMAKAYYEKAIRFGDLGEAEETGYYIYSVLNLGRIAEEEGETKLAKSYYKRVRKLAKRGSPAFEAAKKSLKSL